VREDAATKAVRLLASRRVHIVRVDGPDVDAIVEGDHETYVVGRRRGRFVCTCPSPGPCSHGRAVDAVVDPAPQSTPRRGNGSTGRTEPGMNRQPGLSTRLTISRRAAFPDCANARAVSVFREKLSEKPKPEPREER
jgi:hypothetical protein